MSAQNFRTRIRESIENETLQTALDNNAERRLKGRAMRLNRFPIGARGVNVHAVPRCD